MPELSLATKVRNAAYVAVVDGKYRLRRLLGFPQPIELLRAEAWLGLWGTTTVTAYTFTDGVEQRRTADPLVLFAAAAELAVQQMRELLAQLLGVGNLYPVPTVEPEGLER